MGVNSTLIKGFESQLKVMIKTVKNMEGYTEEDLNPYWEFTSDLENALDSLGYIRRDLQ